MANQKTIELRKRILNSVDKAPRTAGQIAKLLNRGGLDISPSKVGNNLRYLEKSGYVSYFEEKWGKKFWVRNDSADHYTDEPCVSLFVEIPQKLNDELDRVSQKLKITKSQLVREALEEQLGV